MYHAARRLRGDGPIFRFQKNGRNHALGPLTQRSVCRLFEAQPLSVPVTAAVGNFYQAHYDSATCAGSCMSWNT